MAADVGRSGPKEGFGSSVGISEKDVPFVGDLDGCRSCEQKKSKDYGGDFIHGSEARGSPATQEFRNLGRLLYL